MCVMSSKKMAIAMFGQKRLSREGGIEIVVKELCTRIPYMNSDYSEYLVKVLADDYSEEKWNWIKKLTGIHKLTYKLDADIKHGHNFYDYLITSSDEKNTK